MKTKTILLGLTGGLLAFVGFNKYNELKKLYDISVSPGQKPFSVIGITKDIVKCIVNLIVDNPTAIEINLDAITVQAYYKGIYLGRVLPIPFVLKASGKTALSLPLEVLSGKMLNAAKDVLLQEKVDVLFKCFITVKAFGQQATIPYDLIIDVKEQLLDYVKQNYLSQPIDISRLLF